MKNNKLKEGRSFEAKCSDLGKVKTDFRRNRRLFGDRYKQIKRLSNEKNCRFVLWCGNKRLIKQKLLDEYISGVGIRR